MIYIIILKTSSTKSPLSRRPTLTLTHLSDVVSVLRIGELDERGLRRVARDGAVIFILCVVTESRAARKALWGNVSMCICVNV